jgi:probable F420-dependent oxidoreductase
VGRSLGGMGKFRFGVSLWSIGGRAQWMGKCRRAEELGYDVITVPDHLGKPSPFPALSVAAAVTERPRVGTMVINVPFYNPTLLARDIAATVQLSGDRLDLGLGAGHMKSEFDDAGVPWHRAAERIDFLGRTLGELRRHLDDEGGEQPPLLIAGNSDGVLDLAAEHADIVGFAGLRQKAGEPPGTFQLDSAEAMDDRVSHVLTKASTGKAVAPAADIEFNMLVQSVSITDDRRVEAEAWHTRSPNLSVDEVMEAPQLLFGSVTEMIEQLQARRERYGFSYVTVFEAELEKFAPIISELSGQ